MGSYGERDVTGVTAIMAGMRPGFEPLQVAANDIIEFGIAPGTVVTGTPNTTPSGGAPPYTYAWSYVSGEPGISISNPSVQNPTWSFDFIAPSIVSAVWRVTLTDSIGSVPATALITIDISTL